MCNITILFIITFQHSFVLWPRCFPNGQSQIELKDEPIFKQEKCTVSWHADSTLEHFSTIGVYHVTSHADDPCAQDTSSKPDCDKEYKGDKKRPIKSPSDTTEAEADASWRIAMRVHYDAEGPNVGKPVSRAAEMKSLDETKTAVPPVLFALPSKSAYFLLDDFNHHHQHSGKRRISLHRQFIKMLRCLSLMC